MTGVTPVLAPNFRRRKRPVRRRPVAGYTVVEVLMSLAVLAVGVIGIIAMHKVTIASNVHAKNLSIATHIGQSWLGMLEAEASLWGADGSFLRTTWLAQGNGSSDWFRPGYDPTRVFGPAFDALGNPVTDANQGADARFCVDLRMSPLNPASDGAGLIRVEARVVWLRDEGIVAGSVVPPSQACGLTAADLAGADAQRLFHFVFMSGAIRQVVT
jgi:Tfp pilus assembly protein PilV